MVIAVATGSEIQIGRARTIFPGISRPCSKTAPPWLRPCLSTHI